MKSNLQQKKETLLALAISIFLLSVPTNMALQMVALDAKAQNPEDFLNEEDYDAPPPGMPPAGTFMPNPADASANQPPPPAPPNVEGGAQDFSGGNISGSSASFGNKKDRKNRKDKFAPLPGDELPSVSESAKGPDMIESFDFPNAEISDVIKAISELTGKNFIIDPNVRGKITIIAPSKISVAEAYKAFLSALAINGFTVVPSGKFYKIKSSRNAQRDSINTYWDNYSPDSDQMITRIIHLKHISAEEVNKNLRMLTSKDGELAIYPPTNSIILSDYGANIDRVVKILSQLDVPGFEEQMEVIPIRNAKAKDIADLADQIINKGESKKAGRGGAFTSGIPRFGAAQSNTKTAFSMVIPDDRTNSVIVVGNTAGIVKIKNLIKQLDFRIRPEDAGGVYVYNVKYGNAEKLAEVINGVTKENKKKDDKNAPPMPLPGMMEPVAGSEGIFGGDVKITADKSTNSLIITASKQDYEVLKSLLKKIDVVKNQVYVEAVIMEMSNGGSNTWGVTYYQLDKDSKGVGRAGFSGGRNLQSLINPTADSGAIMAFASGDSFEFDAGGVKTTVKSLLGFITFLKQVTDVNILSTPQILAMDNEDAEIEVGDQVPVGATTTTSATGPAQTSIQREDATIKLKITPNISPGTNTVRMKIDQSIKQLTDKPIRAKNLADSSVITSTRSIKTQIAVKNGDTAVLGGLIKDQEAVSVTKVPILGDIPIIGWLFKSKSTNNEKVNLLMFLTPKIIRTTEDRHEILSQKLNERLDFVKSNYGGLDVYGKTHDKLGKALKPKEGKKE